MFINWTGIIGSVISTGTVDVTGNLFVTLLLVLMFLIIVGIMFSIPLEFLSIIVLPVCISSAAYYSNFIAPMGVILIYITTIITKNWLFK